jgi:hypothetical protein
MGASGVAACRTAGTNATTRGGYVNLTVNSGATPFAALTIRSLKNERDDFLMTTFPIADANPAHDLAETIITKPTKNIFFAVLAVQFLMWLLIRSKELAFRAESVKPV